jgi:alpha-L-arabinofuranosidase
VQAPGVAYRKPRSSRGEQIVRLAGSASRRDKDRVTLTLAHLHASEPAKVVIRLRGGSAGEVRHTVLTHAELNAHNSFERPEVVKPSSSVLDVHGTELRCTLPAASVNALEIRLS